MTRITLTLPLPPRELHPNHRSRSHWPATNAKKKYRRAAAEAGIIARPCQDDLPWQEARIQATFYVRDRRGLARDGDGANASLKSAIDGLQIDRTGIVGGRVVSKPGAGIIADDNGVVLLPPRFEVDKSNPRVVLVIEPLKGGDGDE